MGVEQSGEGIFGRRSHNAKLFDYYQNYHFSVSHHLLFFLKYFCAWLPEFLNNLKAII